MSEGDVGPLRLAGNRALFPFAPDGREDWNEVEVLDLNSGSLRTVARSQWRSGLINWVAEAGGWVAWVDQSRRQSDSNPNVLWRLQIENMETGEQRQLATNGHTPDPFVPQVMGQDNYLFWTQAEPDRTAHEFIWRDGWRQPRTLLSHVEMTPGSETVSNGELIYLSRAATGQSGHTIGGDCWAVDLQGGQPHPLTHTALAMGCAASDGWLVWTQHINPATSKPPSDGILDDPYTVWSRPLSSGQARRIHQGYLSMGYPDVGDGFTVWPAGGATQVIHSLRSSAMIRLRTGDAGFPAAGDGARFAFVTGGQGKPPTIRVMRIRASEG